jgi:hypothetical protein
MKHIGAIQMDNEIIETIELNGFDPSGEPEIRCEDSGQMWLVFNFMPPIWMPNEDLITDFDVKLQEAIGTEVIWDDREFFYIENPLPDTPQRIQSFLVKFRAENDSSQ